MPEPVLRTLAGPDATLEDLYAYPGTAAGRCWVRANMVSTLDGTATGADGLSGSISSTADKQVFAVLRGLADVVLVAAGTVRAEGYRPPEPRARFAAARAARGQTPAPGLAVVTRSGEVPPRAFGGSPPTIVLTCEAAGGDRLSALRRAAAPGEVVVAGDDAVDPALALAALAERGLTRVLCEGGPTLLRTIAAAGLLDELCLTWSPLLQLDPSAARIVDGPRGEPMRLRLAHLLESDSVLIGRWLAPGRAGSAHPG